MSEPRPLSLAERRVARLAKQVRRRVKTVNLKSLYQDILWNVCQWVAVNHVLAA